MKEIRVGIIGGGMISHRHMTIYSNIQKHAAELGFTAKVVAISEIDEAKLKAWAEKYGFDEKDCYTDFREMLKRDDLDTVDVCVHNNLHAPVSIAVMKAGFDCYCEKPVASNYADAKMMMDCAEKLGRKFHVQISSLMTPQSRVARDMIARGDLGDLYYVNLHFFSQRRRPGYDLPQFTTDFYTKKVAGHGPSIDLGIYLISQILFITGVPELDRVSGFATRGLEYNPAFITDPEGFGVEDFGTAMAKYKNGMTFNLLAASAGHYKDYGMTYVLGSKGGLEITGTDTTGGPFAAAANADAATLFGGHPELKFYGDVNGRLLEYDVNCWENGNYEQRTDPAKWLLYNDNQCMWLAYKLGILDDTTRYNTPNVALNMLKLTDGMFLSSELGREVTADEIVAMSKSMAITEQDIPGGTIHYDLSF